MATRISLLLSLFCISIVPASAQDEVGMADVMRSNGSIYVVVGIILIVVVGLFLYLISLDRKIGRIEQRLKDRK